MSVRELLTRVDSDELARWIQYYRLVDDAQAKGLSFGEYLARFWSHVEWED